MGLLTSKAIEGFRSYVKRTVSYAKYKIGSTYYKVKIDNITVDSTGVVRISFMINPDVSGNVKITEVQLYDDNNDLWFTKPVSLDMSTVAEGFYYLVKFHITETEQK